VEKCDTLGRMSWTKWRLLADGKEWFDDSFDYEGPCCYELATAGPQCGNVRIHYVGETKNEKKRMTRYGQDGSHLTEIIHSHLKAGWCLWYRSWSVPSKAAAIAMQNRLLADNKYDWNVLLNQDEDD
jgi:GIY-YIG domain-containing protein